MMQCAFASPFFFRLLLEPSERFARRSVDERRLLQHALRRRLELKRFRLKPHPARFLKLRRERVRAVFHPVRKL